MSYIIISACCVTQSQPPIEKQHTVQLHSCEEKLALITDIFLTSLAAAVAIGIILTANGLIDLGPLNAISTLGPEVAYRMFGVAGGVVIVDTMIVMAKMSSHISRIAKLNQTLGESEDTQNFLRLTNEHQELTKEHRELTKELTNQKAAFQELHTQHQLQAASEKARITSENFKERTSQEQIVLLDEIKKLQEESVLQAQAMKTVIQAEVEELQQEKATLNETLSGLRAEKERLENVSPTVVQPPLDAEALEKAQAAVRSAEVQLETINTDIEQATQAKDDLAQKVANEGQNLQSVIEEIELANAQLFKIETQIHTQNAQLEKLQIEPPPEAVAFPTQDPVVQVALTDNPDIVERTQEDYKEPEAVASPTQDPEVPIQNTPPPETTTDNLDIVERTQEDYKETEAVASPTQDPEVPIQNTPPPETTTDNLDIVERSEDTSEEQEISSSDEAAA